MRRGGSNGVRHRQREKGGARDARPRLQDDREEQVDAWRRLPSAALPSAPARLRFGGEEAAVRVGTGGTAAVQCGVLRGRYALVCCCLPAEKSRFEMREKGVGGQRFVQLSRSDHFHFKMYVDGAGAGGHAAGRDHIDARFGDPAYVVKTDAAGRF